MPSVIVKTEKGKRLSGVNVEIKTDLFGIPQKFSVTTNHLGEATVANPGVLMGGKYAIIYCEAEYEGTTYVYNGNWPINMFGNYVPTTNSIELSSKIKPRPSQKTDFVEMYKDSLTAIVLVVLALVLWKYMDFSTTKRYSL